MEHWLTEILSKYGPVVACLVGSLWWMTKEREKLLTALHAKSEAHLDAVHKGYGARIQLLETSHGRLAGERDAMHKELKELQTELRSLYRDMLTSSRSGKCAAECVQPKQPKQ